MSSALYNKRWRKMNPGRVSAQNKRARAKRLAENPTYFSDMRAARYARQTPEERAARLAKNRAQCRAKYSRKSEFLVRVKRYVYKNRCADCRQQWHFCVLDFDHLPQFKKEMNVGKSVTADRRRLKAEIRKCELVCSNCHRIRTFERRRSLRGAPGRVP